MCSFVDWILEKGPDMNRTALSVQSGGDYSINDILAEMEKIELLFHQHGGVRGKKVALLVPSVFSFVSIALAINRQEGIIVPISPFFRKDDLTSLLQFLDPHIIFTVDEHQGFDFAQIIRSWAASCGKHTVVFRSKDYRNWNVEQYKGEERPAEKQKIFNISCSSGSTGLPKGIMVNADWFKQLVRAIPIMFDLNPADKVLSMIPIASNLGLGIFLSGLYQGVHISFVEAYDFPSIVKLMDRQSCNKMITTPSLFNALKMFAKNIDASVLETLQMCGLAGEKVTDEFLTAHNDMPNCVFRSGYGLSELGALLYTENCFRQGFDFVSVPGVEYKIENGEIVFKTSGFLGYYQRPDLTAEVFRDGWFYTGDMAECVDDGKIRIIGRMKDIIKKGGQQVIPGEIEYELSKHPKIKRVAVVGAPHRVFGEQIVAFIIPKEPMKTEEVYDFLHLKLAGYKIPDQIHWLDEFPVSQGKLDKVTLRKKAAELYGGS